MAKKKKVRTEAGGEVDLIVPEHIRELSIAAMDRADAAAVVESVTVGRDLSADVYSFMQDGKLVVGPSIIGVRRCFLGHYEKPIVIEQVVTDRFEQHKNSGCPTGAMVNRVMVRGKGPDGSGPEIGIIDQPEFQKRRDGSWVWDKHSISKAASMARRNLMKDLLPPDTLAAFVKKCLANPKKVMQLTAEDARDAKPDRTPFWRTQERRLFAIVSKVIDLGKEENKKRFEDYVAAAMGGVRISEMNDEQIRGAAEGVQKTLTSLGKEAFVKQVLGHDEEATAS